MKQHQTTINKMGWGGVILVTFVFVLLVWGFGSMLIEIFVKYNGEIKVAEVSLIYPKCIGRTASIKVRLDETEYNIVISK